MEEGKGERILSSHFNERWCVSKSAGTLRRRWFGALLLFVKM